MIHNNTDHAGKIERKCKNLDEHLTTIDNSSF